MDTTLLKEQWNVWPPDKTPRLSSMSIVKHKDYMMKYTLMAPKINEGAEATAFTDTELLPIPRPSSSRCSILLWLNVLFAGNWGCRQREPFYLSYHEHALVIEWQGHTYPLMMDTKPLWNWGKCKSGPTNKRDHWPWHRPTGKCPLYRFEDIGPNQVGCSCTWRKSRETNTRATEKIPALNQSWRGCNHPTSNWPYQGHQVPYIVPRTAYCLFPLWSNAEHWPYAPGVYSVTWMSWRILQNWLIQCSLRDNYRDLHCGISTRIGIPLSDMNSQTFYTIPHLNHPRSDAIC